MVGDILNGALKLARVVEKFVQKLSLALQLQWRINGVNLIDMKEINETILAHLLKIKEELACNKIIACKTLAGIKVYRDEDVNKTDPDLTVDTELISKFVRADLVFAIENIQKSYTTSLATKKYIMEYPVSSLKPNPKTRLYPSSISLPPALKMLLTDDQKKWILSYWEEKYQNYIVKYGITFKV